MNTEQDNANLKQQFTSALIDATEIEHVQNAREWLWMMRVHFTAYTLGLFYQACDIKEQEIINASLKGNE